MTKLVGGRSRLNLWKLFEDVIAEQEDCDNFEPWRYGCDREKELSALVKSNGGLTRAEQEQQELAEEVPQVEPARSPAPPAGTGAPRIV